MGNARRWEVISTPEAKRWYAALEPEAQARVTASINRLRQVGPTLGRPTADRVHASRHHNMKELRSTGGHLRVLFAFDKSRMAILLVGGDKTDNWAGWYEANIPIADERFAKHQATIGETSARARKRKRR